MLLFSQWTRWLMLINVRRMQMMLLQLLQQVGINSFHNNPASQPATWYLKLIDRRMLCKKYTNVESIRCSWGNLTHSAFTLWTGDMKLRCFSNNLLHLVIHSRYKLKSELCSEDSHTLLHSLLHPCNVAVATVFKRHCRNRKFPLL